LFWSFFFSVAGVFGIAAGAPDQEKAAMISDQGETDENT
jgi:hypothetical protein